jgi:hypothetical protein
VIQYLEGLQHELVIVAAVLAIAGVLRFEMYCLDDILHADYVRTLTRQAWVVLCVLVIPFGGILYLFYGRPRA